MGNQLVRGVWSAIFRFVGGLLISQQRPLKVTLLCIPTAAEAETDIGDRHRHKARSTTPKEQDVQQQEHRNRDDGEQLEG